MLESQKQMRMELPKFAYRQFEVRGFDRMIDRILDVPLKSASKNKNEELENKLNMIKEALKDQAAYA